VRARGDSALQRLPGAEADEIRLQNQVESLRRLGDQLREDYQKAKIAEAVEVGEVEIVDLAIVPSVPIGGGPRPKLLIGLLVGLVLGAVVPWVYLSMKKKRRIAAFQAQLADTLQLMAGSLSAGLSLAQSVDTVVREGSDPMASEFRRALVETRLGVQIEDALAGVGERMESVDFEWVVMAIRIQREVGGNLSELLNKVADTIREREYLKRQVQTLSAEGRLSVWILGGLPPVFLAYLVLFNPTYVAPMWSNPMGWVMLIVMGVLLSGGIFWMKKVVKVEV